MVTDRDELDMVLAEPILERCMDSMCEAEIQADAAANMMLLFGLETLTANACCEQHLKDQLRHIGGVIAQRTADA